MITSIAFALAVTVTAAAPSYPDDSVYLLDSKLVDQHGDRVRLDVFAGKPVLLAMFYATCPSACPRLIADVRRVLATLPEEQRRDVRVVLVSLDPERDTPAVLAGVVKARGLDDERTRLLAGTPEDTRRLAAILGVKYRDDGKGAIDHSSRIAVVDGKGRIVGRKDGLGGAVTDVSAQLQTLLLKIRE